MGATWRKGVEPPFWWKPWLHLERLRDRWKWQWPVKIATWQHRAWLWWWEIPGHWYCPYKILGRELIWSVNNGGPVAWPGRIRCRFWPCVDDGYDCCCYCGAWDARRVPMRPVTAAEEAEDSW